MTANINMALIENDEFVFSGTSEQRRVLIDSILKTASKNGIFVKERLNVLSLRKLRMVFIRLLLFIGKVSRFMKKKFSRDAFRKLVDDEIDDTSTRMDYDDALFVNGASAYTISGNRVTVATKPASASPPPGKDCFECFEFFSNKPFDSDVPSPLAKSLPDQEARILLDNVRVADTIAVQEKLDKSYRESNGIDANEPVLQMDAYTVDSASCSTSTLSSSDDAFKDMSSGVGTYLILNDPNFDPEFLEIKSFFNERAAPNGNVISADFLCSMGTSGSERKFGHCMGKLVGDVYSAPLGRSVDIVSE